MVYIKKLIMHGFKSFPRKTEIPFTPEINVVLGPNGSGKSNISDALCFVLGRLSIKSLRAAKAKNLIFMGTKSASPSKEASVELIFDNKDKTFSFDKDEVSIKRIVRKNGQSTYKINNETKTRQEILSLLSQAGIDPNGFNIILQGEIQNFVRMHNEERRKIIEEVSGISIYESRKEKSLRELKKTGEKLKEIHTVLKERTSYLNNLEKERKQALRYKKLEKNIKDYKASIINHDLQKNKKQSENINSEIEKKQKELEKIKKIIAKIKTDIKNTEDKINSINSDMQKSTGLEQEQLNKEITNLRAELAGLNVNIENYERKLSQIEKQKRELKENIQENENSIKDFQKKSPEKKTKDKQKELSEKKQDLEKLEEQRKKFYMIKSEFSTIKERLDEKNSALKNYENESDFLVRQIKSLGRELYDRNTSEKKINQLKISLAEKKQFLEDLAKKEIELDKISYNNEHEIEKQKKLSERISDMDKCPICKNEITEEHASQIKLEAKQKIDELKRQISESDKKISEIYDKKKILEQDIEQINSEINKRETDLVKLSNINEKEVQIKSLREKQEKLKNEINTLNKKRKSLAKKIDDYSNIEEKYETLKIEVQEISMRNQENLDSEVAFKKRELERMKISLKQFSREENDINEELSQLKKKKEQKQSSLNEKRQKEQELTRKFQKLISERDSLQKKIRNNELQLSTKQNLLYNSEQEINNFKIDKARIDASVENLESELSEFQNPGIIRTKKENLIQKLEKTQRILERIGSVNLRSLEVYDSVKKEYDSIKEKAETIDKEKESILKVISEIDLKKKKVFLKTLKNLNEIFSRNFSRLSSKGRVFLELENKKEPFSAGVNILVKTGHGKYFDVASLSGGEQTIVALSLIFAIQELNPYAFYILDEIDAALDKRNSERLASLLKRYMEKGQYIVITHNDEVISNASNLYGVSMHDGISKIVSLKV